VEAMMGIMKYIQSGKKLAWIFMICAAPCFVSFDAYAVCSATTDSRGITPECPNGNVRRTDISPKCIEDKAASSCVNIMPVTGVSRVPEDVCFRGAGWSRQRNHNGMDYAAPKGAPITAAADGIVDLFRGNPHSARQISGYGNVVFLRHEGCVVYYTIYAHMEALAPDLKNQMKVTKGQVIGYVGDTGSPGQVHLHFEMRMNSKTGAVINPMCDGIQALCNCQTPVPKVDINSCRDATFQPGTPAVVSMSSFTDATLGAENRGGTAISMKCPYEQYRDRQRQWGCLFCKPFQIIFNTASVMAQKSFDLMARAVARVVLVAFALWLAITTLRFVSTWEIREPRIYIKTLLNQSFRVMVVVLLLYSNLSDVLRLTLDPVFATGLKIAQLSGKINEVCDLGTMKVITAEDGGGLSVEMGTGILCTIKSIQDQIIDVMALGSTYWCMAWRDRTLYIFPNLAFLITGVIFWIAAFLLLFIYPFLLIDAVLKMAIAISLFPAALGAFAFKITSHYLKKVWDTFMNAIFSFIFLSIIILIIGSIAADTAAEILAATDGKTFAIFWWAIPAMKLAFVLLLGWAVLGETKKFSDDFASGLNLQDIGAKTGSSAGAATKWAGKKAGKPVAKGAKHVGRQAGGLAAEGFGKLNAGRKRVMANMRGPAKNKDGSVMTDEQGNAMYKSTSAGQMLKNTLGRLVGQKGTRHSYSTFTESSEGHAMVTRTQVNRDGSKEITQSDAFGTVKSTVAANGKVVAKETKVNALGLKNMVYKDGSVNSTAINNFMQRSSFSEQDKQLIIMQKIISERMGAGYAGPRPGDASLDSTMSTSTDANGHQSVTITQTNMDGSKSTFSISYGNNNRVMSTVETIGTNGKGASYSTDGIVQCKTRIEVKTFADGGTQRSEQSRYAFSSYYSDRTSRPLYTDGDYSGSIPKDEIMFGKERMQGFVNQVVNEGNKKYTFSEFN